MCTRRVMIGILLFAILTGLITLVSAQSVGWAQCGKFPIILIQEPNLVISLKAGLDGASHSQRFG